MAIKIQANIQWQAKQSASSSRWICVCEPMNLVLEADSMEEIPGLINEAMNLLFIDLLEDNELDEFLRARGWQAFPGVKKDTGDGVEFDVPWQLLVAGNARDPQQQAN